MRRGEECDLADARDQIGRAGVMLRHALRRAQELLDEEPAEAVPDHDHWAACERRLGQQSCENIGRLVGEVQGSSGDRHVVADHVNRKRRVIIRQPARPECLVELRLLAHATPPGVVGMTPGAVHQEHARTRLAGRAGHLEQVRHRMPLKENGAG